MNPQEYQRTLASMFVRFVKTVGRKPTEREAAAMDLAQAAPALLAACEMALDLLDRTQGKIDMPRSAEQEALADVIAVVKKKEVLHEHRDL